MKNNGWKKFFLMSILLGLTSSLALAQEEKGHEDQLDDELATPAPLIKSNAQGKKKSSKDPWIQGLQKKRDRNKVVEQIEGSEESAD